MNAIDKASKAEHIAMLPVEYVAAWRATEAALNDTIQQKETQLLELQHRIANSLQIIASILQTKARAVDSEETRGHLQDAYQRVMSIAALQEQLKESRYGDAIAVGPYLQRLCETLAASMISGDRAISVTASAAAGERPARDVMGLGLIVTELLINAVKYAFPDPATCGRIAVDYRAGPAGWSLAVSDNGVGLAPSAANGSATSGVGTRIVAALARRLGARVETSSSETGTRISIRHWASVPLHVTAD